MIKQQSVPIQQQQQEEPQVDMCPRHKGKPIEFISIDAKERICAHCALFGEYKNHDIRPEQDVVDEISTRTECLMEMFSMIQTNMSNQP